MKKPKIIAVIPAYNEEKTIATVILETEKHVDKIIVVDDGSTDHTAEIAKRMGVTVISHPKNMGKGEALRTGFKEALKQSPDIIITLDADLQHDPKDIPQIVQPIIEGKADIVIGSRFIKGAKMDAPLYRRIGLSIINKLHKTQIKDTQSGYRAFSAKAVEKILQHSTAEGYGIESEQLIIASTYGLKILEVPITVKYKGLKTSKKHLLIHGSEIIDTLLDYILMQRPLLFLAIPGTTLFLTGIALGIYLLHMYVTLHYLNVPLAVISTGIIILGVLLTTTAMILHAIRVLKIRLSHGQNST